LRGIPNVLILTTNSNIGFFVTNNVSTGGVYKVAITNIAGNAIGGFSSKCLPLRGHGTTNQQVNLGDSASFSVSPVDPGLFTYQWQFNGANINNATIPPWRWPTFRIPIKARTRSSSPSPRISSCPNGLHRRTLYRPPTQPSLLNSQLFPDGSFTACSRARLIAITPSISRPT